MRVVIYLRGCLQQKRLLWLLLSAVFPHTFWQGFPLAFTVEGTVLVTAFPDGHSCGKGTESNTWDKTDALLRAAVTATY